MVDVVAVTGVGAILAGDTFVDQIGWTDMIEHRSRDGRLRQAVDNLRLPQSQAVLYQVNIMNVNIIYNSTIQTALVYLLYLNSSKIYQVKFALGLYLFKRCVVPTETNAE